ncbi:Protein CLEC16A [Trichinella spiralis]|uniref:Dimethyladenosine transferase 1, mitochondrial n=1 Tax=Trichinella spiralis TaxID=6334 RepID=A0A0V1BM93_TRISP|nr:Protein CLEC16A [Trichinella spiralis]
MPKGKLFSTGGLWKPKNQHSLEYLKYLCDLLTKNAIVTEQNRALLVEALRLISEILIWGDQNDSSVFDFFLEKNMLSFFLFIMRQKCGRFVCIQLLQTLNILFENIRNETSLYYLLSNNHVNSIITYRFDFSDEEILAYYISFLKTLSFKLNVNTVHFFFNEICIRKYLHVCVLVNDPQVIRFIRDNTAVPYFSNLVWFIRQRANEINGSGVDRMRDLIADHQDHIHYLNDILCLDVEDLNKVLIDQLMSKLFLPVYLNSIYAIPDINDERPFSLLVTVFFLTQSGNCNVGNYATPILQLILRSHDEDCPVRIATLELCCTYITQLFHSSKMHSRVILETIPRLKHCRHLIEQKLIPCIEAFDTFIELFEDEATAFMLLRSWFILSKLLTNLRAESLELEKTMQPVLSVKEGDCMNLGKFFFLLTRCYRTVICWLVQLYTTTIGNAQLYFVEPDSSKVGWGVVRFVGQLQGCSQSRKYRLVTICDLLHVKVPEPAGPLPSRVFHNLTTGSKVELSPTNSSNEEPKKQDDIDGVVEEMRCIDLGQSPKPAKLLFSQKFNTTIANAAEVTEYCQEQPASSISAPLPDHLKPTCMIVLGMAGSGKSTLVQRICAYLSATKTSLYPVNLDPAVHYVSYPTAVDMLFLILLAKSNSLMLVLFCKASSFPTVIVYVMDVARSSSPITFTSNMLYACSIMYKTQLPMVVAMNKTDIISANFALDWINDFECFLEALDSETSFAGDLTRRLALGLEEFYKTLKCTGVSAISGEGMKRFFELIDQARLEYETYDDGEFQQRRFGVVGVGMLDNWPVGLFNILDACFAWAGVVEEPLAAATQQTHTGAPSDRPAREGGDCHSTERFANLGAISGRGTCRMDQPCHCSDLAWHLNLISLVQASWSKCQGIVRVGVIAATNLENKDSFLKGKSDPYVRITVGGQIYQTKTIENNLNPVWNEEFDAIVDHADGQYLGVELYDEDPGSRDEFLGNLDLDMDSVRSKGYISDWYALNAVKHGNVNLSVHWMNLSSDASLLDDVQNLPHSVPSSGPRNHALLMIYVDCIKNLPLIAESSGGIMDIRIGDVMKYEIETEFPADVKREWSEEPPPVHVIGNLPFNVSTYLIIKWLRAMSLHEGPFVYGRTLLTLTFQKEVGLRMLAPIFNRHRCRLSVMCQYLSDVKRKFTIPGRACVPSPDVDVAVMQFRPKVTPVIPHHFDLVEKFCRHVFHYRNKYCIRGIETLFPDFLKKDFSHEILRFARVSPKLAPPALAIEEIRDMCKIYEEQCLRVPSLFYYDYRQRKDFEEVQRNCPAEPPLLKHLSSNVETFSERL